MSCSNETSRIASHTEYARTRIQCVGCGKIAPVPADDKSDRKLCGRCSG